MLDQEAITQQLTLLAAHRRTLAHLLQQAAQYGGEVFAPPQTANGIAEARTNIARIKAYLRESSVEVEDEQNDEAPPAATVTQGGEPAGTGPRVQSTVTIQDNKGTAIGVQFNQPDWSVSGNVYNVAGDQRNVNTGGGPAVVGNQIGQGNIVTGGTIQGDVIGQQTITQNYFQPPATPLDRQQQRNRRAMLTKVKTIWIDGLLEQSLDKELRIALELTKQPDAVDLPLNALVQELQHSPRALPAGTPIIKVFDQIGGALLILGAPGAGKTTLLLELARDLITRAEQDEGHPIPVVFNLSSWAERRQPLKDWLFEELNTKYEVPRKLAQMWMDTDVVLPLLDGLDEVAAQQRDDCVDAINTYRQAHGLVPLAVCSRVADYEALTSRLRLQGAIVVQPLTKQQVDAYLERAGEKLAGARTVLHDDVGLGELLDTPLMLSVVALAYKDKPLAELQGRRTPDERRWHLFDAYIEAMFQRRSKERRYTHEQMTSCLSWLADQMVRASQTAYYIERMQPDWLDQNGQVWYAILTRLLSLLIVWLGVGLGAGLVVGPIIGLIVGLLAGLVVELYGERLKRIELYETLRWSGPSLHVGLRSGLVFGLIGGLLAGLRSGLVFGLIGGLGFGLVAGLIVGLAGELSGGEVETKIRPNQGILRSIRNWFIGGLISGLGGGLGGGLIGGLLAEIGIGLGGGLVGGLIRGLIGGLIGGLIAGPILGLAVGLNYGGRSVLQHYTLRWMLSRNGSLPLRLVPFLDYCVERIFLRKVGGGYIFVHRLLMEHFASLNTEQPAEPAQAETTTS